MLKVTAPGKIILSGEHSVVYGYPALVVAVDRRLRLLIRRNRKNLIIEPSQAKNFVKHSIRKTYKLLEIEPKFNYSIKISSDIPIGCGMGSSAAFAVTMAAAILKLEKNIKNLKKINEIAYEIEKKQHRNPSGVDNTIATYGGYIWYRKESERLKTFSKVSSKKRLSGLYIINTGKPEESTGEMVTRAFEFYKDRPKYVEGIFVKIEKLTRSFLKYTTGEEDYDFGELLRENERLLEKLNVVSRSTISLIRQIERIGGAAKISGAGGISSASGILLVYQKDPGKIENFAKFNNLEISKLKLGERGLKIEKSS